MGDTYCYIINDEGKKIKIEGYGDCCYNTLFLKKEIEKKLGIEIKKQILIVDGKVMKDNNSLKTYGVSNGKIVILKINDAL